MQLIKLTDHANGEFFFGIENLLHIQRVSDKQWENIQERAAKGGETLTEANRPHASLFTNDNNGGGCFLVTETCAQVAELIAEANGRNIEMLNFRLENLTNRLEATLRAAARQEVGA